MSTNSFEFTEILKLDNDKEVINLLKSYNIKEKYNKIITKYSNTINIEKLNEEIDIIYNMYLLYTNDIFVDEFDKINIYKHQIFINYILRQKKGIHYYESNIKYVKVFNIFNTFLE